MTDQPADRTALAAGFFCYLIWGFVPLAFQAMGHLGAGAWEILSHRTLWGSVTALALVLAAGQWGQTVAVFRNPRLLGGLTLSAALIAANWTLFIWAVNSGRVLESSLGYYITPLINMAAGVALFRERMDRVGLAAIALAVVGVGLQTVALGHLPWISLVLAFSFGGYGIVRKLVPADAQTGLLVECLILSVPGLVYVLWLERQGLGHFTASPVATAWLVAAGPITAIPLAMFSWAARRIPLSYMGFLQFIAPTISFGIGLAEGEAFSLLRAVSFVFIWGGAAVFTYGAWRRARALRPA